MRYVVRETHEYVRETPEGRFLGDDLTAYRPDQVVAVCDVCEEPGADPDVDRSDDVLAEFWDPDAGASVVAHAQCGIDRGLELA